MPLTLKPGYDVGEMIADDPIVWIIDEFVSVEEREHIMRVAEKGMSAAKVSRLGHNAPSAKRTGSVAWVKHDQTPIVRGLVKRVSDLVGIPVNHAESLQVVHYAETQEYQPHYDAWDIFSEKGQEKTASGGNRALTALMYLNEVDGGGGTGFPKLDVAIEAVPGRLCIFHDLYPDRSERHIDALHGGLPVTAGEKWACNLWFRERPYQKGPARTSARTGGAPAGNRAQRRKSQKSKRRR